MDVLLLLANDMRDIGYEYHAQFKERNSLWVADALSRHDMQVVGKLEEAGLVQLDSLKLPVPASQDW